MTYIAGAGGKKEDGGCFFCRAWRERGRERENLLLARSGDCLVMLNRFPYVNAHLLLAPSRHVGGLEETTEEEGRELWRLAGLSKLVLSNALAPHGFNIGINQGRTAGAGVLDHLHVHVVPRWEGDVNFMPVLADVRVMPQALEETWEKLKPYFDRLPAE
jgi:ATP adenylyltransferase